MFVALVLLALPVRAQSTPVVDIFGGYSNLQASYNGWNAAATFNFTHWLGVVADGSGYYTTTTVGGGSTSSQINAAAYAALFGPEVSLRTSRVRLFGRGFVGPVQVTAAVPALNITAAQSKTGYGGGLGLDLHINSYLGVRLFQADYIHTNFASQTQDLGRISGGITISLGRH